MGKRAAAREARQLIKREQFERAKQIALARVEQVQPDALVPRVAQLPDDQRLTPRMGVSVAALEVPLQPRVAAGGSILHAVVTWCMRKADRAGHWSWGHSRDWSDGEWAEIIRPAFAQFEQLTWGEIRMQGSDTGHAMHHEQEVASIAAEAQERWLELDLEEFDTMFRFRLSNKRRFWGFRIQGHFFGVWWDKDHKIYETQ